MVSDGFGWFAVLVVTNWLLLQKSLVACAQAYNKFLPS